jgi:hypothetical protein
MAAPAAPAATCLIPRSRSSVGAQSALVQPEGARPPRAGLIAAVDPKLTPPIGMPETAGCTDALADSVTPPWAIGMPLADPLRSIGGTVESPTRKTIRPRSGSLAACAGSRFARENTWPTWGRRSAAPGEYDIPDR